jgi:hypothetical protein
MKKYQIILTSLLLASSSAFAVEPTGPKPAVQAQQAAPFSHDLTLQTFTKTAHGGVQHVVVKSAGNSSEIKLIQVHLHKLVDEFRKGDFSTTEKAHGANMPGLAQLKMANPDDIRFDYRELPNGGQIHYSSEYPQYVQALHEWFDAQTAAHGGDVLPEHSQHHAKPAE